MVVIVILFPFFDVFCSSHSTDDGKDVFCYSHSTDDGKDVFCSSHSTDDGKGGMVA